MDGVLQIIKLQVFISSSKGGNHGNLISSNEQKLYKIEKKKNKR